jgi:hypothetical protein
MVTGENLKDGKHGVISLLQVASNEAFEQCMTGVKTRCSDLASAIDNHDFEAVQFVARDAVDM